MIRRAAACLVLIAAPAAAWTEIPYHAPAAGVLAQPYPTAANYCMDGLQPVLVGGVVSCGVPNVAARTAPPPRAYAAPPAGYVPYGKAVDAEGGVYYRPGWKVGP